MQIFLYSHEVKSVFSYNMIGRLLSRSCKTLCPERFHYSPMTEKEKLFYAFRFFGIILSYKFQGIVFRFSQVFQFTNGIFMV
jgi:hypothetical protein